MEQEKLSAEDLERFQALRDKARKEMALFKSTRTGDLLVRFTRLEYILDEADQLQREVERLATTPAPPDAGAAERVAQIRGRLEAATPWPWVPMPSISVPAGPDGEWPTQDRSKWSQHMGVEQDPTIYGRDASSVFYADSKHVGCNLADADFIAHAPEDVAWLLAQLQAATAARATAEAEAAGLRVVAADRGKRLYRALGDLVGMYNQYTPGHFGHDFMSAGEDAQDALSVEGLLDKQDNGIYPDDENAPQSVKDLLTVPAQTPRQAPPRSSGSGEQQEGGEGNGSSWGRSEPRRCQRCARPANAYGQCLHCDTQEPEEQLCDCVLCAVDPLPDGTVRCRLCNGRVE